MQQVCTVAGAAGRQHGAGVLCSKVGVRDWKYSDWRNKKSEQQRLHLEELAQRSKFEVGEEEWELTALRSPHSKLGSGGSPGI